MIEHRLVTKWGKTYLEIKFDGEKWRDWLFNIDTKPHKYWIYVEEFNIWRCNTSI